MPRPVTASSPASTPNIRRTEPSRSSFITKVVLGIVIGLGLVLTAFAATPSYSNESLLVPAGVTLSTSHHHQFIHIEHIVPNPSGIPLIFRKLPRPENDIDGKILWKALENKSHAELDLSKIEVPGEKETWMTGAISQGLMQVKTEDMTHSIMRGTRANYPPYDDRPLIAFLIRDVTTDKVHTQVIQRQYTSSEFSRPRPDGWIAGIGPMRTPGETIQPHDFVRLINGEAVPGSNGHTFVLDSPARQTTQPDPEPLS